MIGRLSRWSLALLSATVFCATLVASTESAASNSPPVVAGRSCDRNPSIAIVCLGTAQPRAGSTFTGVYAWFPGYLYVESVECHAKIGGRLVNANGGVGFAGGRELPSRVARFYSLPDPSGRQYLIGATCSWDIPKSSIGQLLSLVHPPADIPCDVDCRPWGFTIRAGGFFREENQVTWKVVSR
jgi:hypothetical protein